MNIYLVRIFRSDSQHNSQNLEIHIIIIIIIIIIIS
jgi:hypothetical protein